MALRRDALQAALLPMRGVDRIALAEAAASGHRCRHLRQQGFAELPLAAGFGVQAPEKTPAPVLVASATQGSDAG